MKIKDNKGLWWSTRVLTVLIIVFSVFMYMGYRVFPEPEEINPLSTNEIIGFYIVGIGFIGLLFAWKWEITGALISLIAYLQFCRHHNSKLKLSFFLQGKAF